jgi:hypothetical protein
MAITGNKNKVSYENETDKWLNQHGGRTYTDLKWENKKKYVIMRKKGKDVKVFLPQFLQPIQ